MSRNGFSIFVGICLVLMIALIKLNSIDTKYVNQIPLLREPSLSENQDLIESEFSTKGYTLNTPNVIVNPYGISPLTALVMFETEDELIPNVIVKGKNELTTFKGSGTKGTIHYIPIYGLYADRETEVIIKAGNNTKTLKIKADKLPEDFVMPTKVISDKASLTNELYFFTPSNDGYTSAYDVNGDVRWYLNKKTYWNMSRLKNGRLLLSTERSINSSHSTTGLYEMDILGKVYKEYSVPGGFHHDFFEMDNGNLLITTNDFENNQDGNYIVELERTTGAIIKTWNLIEHLTINNKFESLTQNDWFNNKSIWYDKKSNIIVFSNKYQNAVIAIDYDSGKPVWIIGDSNEWTDNLKSLFFNSIERNLKWPSNKHSTKITPEGYVLLLSNENNNYKDINTKSNYVRAVMYEINKQNMIIKQIWQHNTLNSYFLDSFDVDYIAKNHYLIYSGRSIKTKDDFNKKNKYEKANTNAKLTSSAIEILNDKIIFELKFPNNNYHAEKMSLYNQSKFTLGKATHLGTLGKTKFSKESFKLPKTQIGSDDFYASHNIIFKNESDRLTMTGIFEKNSNVKIILYKNFHIKEYDVKVSNNSNVSLCLDVFEPKLKIDKYINKEGLSGEHSIYLQIENKLYNTDFKINFDK